MLGMGHRSINQTVRRKTGTFLCAFIFSIVLFCINIVNALAAETVLQDIRIEAKAKDTLEVRIDLGIPLTYVKHFPQTSGEILQIQLRLPDDVKRQPQKEVRQGAQDLKPPEGQEPLLIYVTYEEGVPGGPYLTLRFAHPVRFDVNTGSNLVSLVITVFDDQKPKPEEKAEEKVVESGKPPVGAASGAAVAGAAAAVTAEKPAAATGADQAAEKPAGEKPTATEGERVLQPGKETEKAKESNEISELMAKARQALTFGDNATAITLLRKIVTMPENEHTQDARELVGLALERDNQIPRAKFEYKKYLKLYEEGEGPTRVRQRLAALESVSAEQKKKLRRSTRTEEGDSYTVFGRWSQAYFARYQQQQPKNDDESVDSEDITLTRRVDSNLSVRGRYRSEDTNIQMVLTANNSYDQEDSSDSESDLSALYVDYDAFKAGYTAVVGRQRARNTGIFSRFDGVLTGYQVLPWIKPNIYFGKPVELNDDRNLDKNMYGFSVDFGEKNDPFNMNLYYIYQSVQEMDDREAVGLSLRQTSKDMTTFGLLDYDILFEQTTLFSLRWGWKFVEESKLNLSYNYRNLLFASNALNSQPVTTDMDDLQSLLSDNEILQLAEDRTSVSQTFTIGNSYQFNKNNQLNVDFSVFKSSGTNTSELDDKNPPGVGGDNIINTVQGSDATGVQYTLSAQWIAGNLFAAQDLYVFGTRYSDLDTYQEVGLFSNARLPLLGNWKPRPRLDMSYRSFGSGSSTDGYRVSVAPSVQFDYRWRKEWIFDFEFGFEYVQYSDDTVDDEIREDIRIGYSYTF